LQRAYFDILTPAVLGCPIYDKIPPNAPTLYVTFDGVISVPENNKQDKDVTATVILTVWSSYTGDEGTKMLANQVGEIIVDAIDPAALDLGSTWHLLKTVWRDSRPAEDYMETRIWYRRIVTFVHELDQVP
jgi:hypothetical protein